MRFILSSSSSSSSAPKPTPTPTPSPTPSPAPAVICTKEARLLIQVLDQSGATIHFGNLEVQPDTLSVNELRNYVSESLKIYTPFMLTYRIRSDIGYSTSLIQNDKDLDEAFKQSKQEMKVMAQTYLRDSGKPEPQDCNRAPAMEAPPTEVLAPTAITEVFTPTVTTEIFTPAANIETSISTTTTETSTSTTAIETSTSTTTTEACSSTTQEPVEEKRESSLIEKLMHKIEALVSAKPEMPKSKSSRATSPMTLKDFIRCLDAEGKMLDYNSFRRRVYLGGVCPSARKVIWRHLLCLFPKGTTTAQRKTFLKAKSLEYIELRDKWTAEYNEDEDKMPKDLSYITSMVRKDVIRTDRATPYYKGKEDNKHTISLFNLLCTYAVNHPNVSYCQGMCDLAAPLLTIQDDEAHAYMLFCALMKRLQHNFTFDSKAVTTKFAHLTQLIEYFDPVFHKYMQTHQVADMIFAYRWLLLEMRREFSFEDSLYFTEVMWSTLPITPCQSELELFQSEMVEEVESVALPEERSDSITNESTASISTMSSISDYDSDTSSEGSISEEDDDKSDEGIDSESDDTMSVDSSSSLDCDVSLISAVSESKRFNIFPPPEEFGCGNPFLQFAALSMMLSQRDLIMKKRMDFGGIVMLYGNYKFQGDVHAVVTEARQLYDAYISGALEPDLHEFENISEDSINEP